MENTIDMCYIQGLSRYFGGTVTAGRDGKTTVKAVPPSRPADKIPDRRHLPTRPADKISLARCLQAAYEAESAMPLYRPLDTVGARGLRSALIRRIWRHDRGHES